MTTTSSGGPIGGPIRGHYALVCASPRPLSIDSSIADLDFYALRNLISGNPLGSSQVTAVVRKSEGHPLSDMRYDIAMRAELAPPYFVRLTEVFQEPDSLASIC